MRDRFGRNVQYLRLSVTDRCNLRCRYCMPEGVCLTDHQEILSYEEYLRICRIAVSLGITRFKITGGEPLLRRGCTDFIRKLKLLPGVEQVTLTSNGLLLEPVIQDLAEMGLDGVNISLDTLNTERYAQITGYTGPAVPELLRTLEKCRSAGLKTKINTVILPSGREDWKELAGLAQQGTDVRFIELMPVGAAAALERVAYKEVLSTLKQYWPELHPVEELRGNGPAQYWGSRELTGRIGFIHAVSDRFCDRCNRVRLTAAGFLKPCLCYEQGVELKYMLRGGCSDEMLRNCMEEVIREKPRAHCFERQEGISESRNMHQIGG